MVGVGANPDFAACWLCDLGQVAYSLCLSCIVGRVGISVLSAVEVGIAAPFFQGALPRESGLSPLPASAMPLLCAS